MKTPIESAPDVELRDFCVRFFRDAKRVNTILFKQDTLAGVIAITELLVLPRERRTIEDMHGKILADWTRQDQ